MRQREQFMKPYKRKSSLSLTAKNGSQFQLDLRKLGNFLTASGPLTGSILRCRHPRIDVVYRNYKISKLGLTS
jgi:hypothetical protein